MSQANLEIVRQYLAAYNAPDVETGFELLAPDITWRAIEGAPDDIGVFQGHQALRDYYQQWVDMFDGIRTEIVGDLEEIGAKVIAETRVTARMKSSDTKVEMTLAIVFEVRDGKIISGREYATRAEAVAAGGG